MFINSRGKGLWGKDIVEITKRLKNNDETSLLNVKLAKKDKSVFSELIQANLTSNFPYNIATIIACFILFVIVYPRLKKAVHL